MFRVYVAGWSEQSKLMANTIETFGEHFLNGVEIQVSALEDEPELHAQSAIRVYPTTVKYLEGVEVARHVGPLDLIGLVEYMKE